jgi:hypothetical protein
MTPNLIYDLGRGSSSPMMQARISSLLVSFRRRAFLPAF